MTRLDWFMLTYALLGVPGICVVFWGIYRSMEEES